MRLSKLRALMLPAVAWSGVVAGHAVAYVLADPSAVARHAHLDSTGHGSFHRLVLPAIATAVVGLALAGVRAASGGSEVRRRNTALALAAAQTPVFVLLELAERHFSPLSAMTDPAVLIGLAVQVAVAVLAALALGAFHRVVAGVAGRIRRRAHPAPVRSLRRPVGAVRGFRSPRLRLCAHRRAPPLPLAA